MEGVAAVEEADITAAVHIGAVDLPPSTRLPWACIEEGMVATASG